MSPFTLSTLRGCGADDETQPRASKEQRNRNAELHLCASRESSNSTSEVMLPVLSFTCNALWGRRPCGLLFLGNAHRCPAPLGSFDNDLAPGGVQSPLFSSSLGVAVALWIFASYRRPLFPLGGRDPGTSSAADMGFRFFAIHLSHRCWLEPT